MLWLQVLIHQSVKGVSILQFMKNVEPSGKVFPTKIQPPISNDLRCQLYETHFEIYNSTITIPDVSIPKEQVCK